MTTANMAGSTSTSAPKTVLALVTSEAVRAALTNQPGEFSFIWSLDRQAGADYEQPEVAAVAALIPALIIIELDREVRWLAYVRSDPATRRIPVIAITTTSAGEDWARSVGAQHIFAPEAFIVALPGILSETARGTDLGALSDQCGEPLPALVIRGLEEFNAGEYFECHETLEAAWNAEAGPVRDLYRAILQVSVAYLQIQRRNFRGAQKMFLRMLQWFAPLPDECRGIDLARLRADVLAVREELARLGPDQISDFDLSLLRPLHYSLE